MLRSIILFPNLNKHHNLIQNIREKYDPLANCIAPHVSLVFPFESDISNEELKQHLDKTLDGIGKFTVEFRGVTGDMRDGYLFLNVKRGNDQIIELHDRLYTGKLKDYLHRGIIYCPHITVGKIDDPDKFNEAIKELSSFDETIIKADIDRIYVEAIDEDNNSIIQFTYELD